MAYRLPYVQPLVSSLVSSLVGCIPVTPDASRTLMVYLWGILWCIYGYLVVYLWVCVVVVVVVSSFDTSVSFFSVSSIGLFWFPLSVSFGFLFVCSLVEPTVLVSSLACV